MNRYGKLFLGLLVVSLLMTIGIYLFLNPEQIPSGFSFFTQPENAS